VRVVDGPTRNTAVEPRDATPRAASSSEAFAQLSHAARRKPDRRRVEGTQGR